jgi:hypothetical protein
MQERQAVVPVGTVQFANNNVRGRLQQFTGKFQLNTWNDRSVDVCWTDPWVPGSRPDKRLTQSVAGSVGRSHQNSIFGLVDDAEREEGHRGRGIAEPTAARVADAAEGASKVFIERCTAGVERSAALTRHTYGTIGVCAAVALLLRYDGSMFVDLRGSLCIVCPIVCLPCTTL